MSYMTEVISRRPDTQGLSAREIAVYDYLDALAIPYRHVAHDAAETMEACAEIDTRLGVIGAELFLHIGAAF